MTCPVRHCEAATPAGYLLCPACFDLLSPAIRVELVAARRGELVALAQWMEGQAGPQGDRLAAVYDHARERSAEAARQAIADVERLRRCQPSPHPRPCTEPAGAA